MTIIGARVCLCVCQGESVSSVVQLIKEIVLNDLADEQLSELILFLLSFFF